MRILSTIRPTQHQLKVLATIYSNKEKPAIAIQQLSNDENLVTARNLLMKWNAIEFSPTKVNVTDVGEKMAIDNNVVDETGQLTDFGQSILPTTSNEPTSNEPVDLPVDDMGGLPSLEGFSNLFKSALLG